MEVQSVVEANSVKTLTPDEQLVKRIRNAAQGDQVFDNICKLWANRDRARQDVTVQTLKQTTKGAGYNYSHSQHESVLRLLAGLDVGTLEQKDGKVVALRNIKYNLKSLGEAANRNKPAPPAIEPFRASYSGGAFKALVENRPRPQVKAPKLTPPPLTQRDQSRHAPLVQTAKPVVVTIDAGNNCPMTINFRPGTDVVELATMLMKYSQK